MSVWEVTVVYLVTSTGQSVLQLVTISNPMQRLVAIK